MAQFPWLEDDDDREDEGPRRRWHSPGAVDVDAPETTPQLTPSAPPTANEKATQVAMHPLTLAAGGFLLGGPVGGVAGYLLGKWLAK